MSDFLIHFRAGSQAERSLALLRQPYGRATRDGWCFAYPWGSAALLAEPLENGANVIEKDRHVIGWVGELITAKAALPAEMARARHEHAQGGSASAVWRQIGERLEGAFALLLLDNDGACIVTDITNSVRVYAGYAATGELLALGTQQDLVALLADRTLMVDSVSAVEFLCSGGISFPHTMYRRVSRLEPARVHEFAVGPDGVRRTQVFPYWQPPAELARADEPELAEELRAALVETVERRCQAGRLAVSLSGGLDSRLIMALVPAAADCIGITFCDTWNREARTAARVARCYGRPWFLISRPGEYLADTMEQGVRFIGCEAFFAHAHAAGLADAIAAHGVDSLLSGTYVDSYLKGCCARDMIRVARLGGLLPPRYRRGTVEEWNGCARADFGAGALAEWQERRDLLVRRFGDPARTSQTEWLELHPDLHGLATWPIERRVLRTRFVAFERRLIEFGFRCPLSLKLGNRIFLRAACELYGKGTQIPNANDGVKPGSGYVSRLVQRAIRKLHDRGSRVLGALGREPSVEHSWHDYQRYWRQSSRLAELREQHGGNLDMLNGAVFAGSGAALVQNRDLNGEYGLRLLQLALWLGLVKDSRSLAFERSITTPTALHVTGQPAILVKEPVVAPPEARSAAPFCHRPDGEEYR